MMRILSVFFISVLSHSCWALSGCDEVSAGWAQLCILQNKKISCVDSNPFNGQPQFLPFVVPKLTDPHGLSGNAGEGCGIDGDSVICWETNGSARKIEGLTHPIMVSNGFTHTCALADEGVKCWGYDSKGETLPPPLINPTAVSAGWTVSCALDDTGVKCWGDNYSGQTEVPTLNHPRMVSAGEGTICALDDDGVKCWGSKALGITNVPHLINPVKVVSGLSNHACAMDDTGVKCWGATFNDYGQTKVPPLINPQNVSVGNGYSCAIDDTGCVCWGLVDPKLSLCRVVH